MEYTQVKISISPALAAAFKVACATSNVSMAAKLSEFMKDFVDFSASHDVMPQYTTLRRRRVAIRDIIRQLNCIKHAQERCRDNIPENLQNSSIFDTAESYISSIDEAIDILGSI